VEKDLAFEESLRAAVDTEIAAALTESEDPLRPHRAVMDRVRLMVAAYLWPASSGVGDPRLIEAARRGTRSLRRLQGPSGLFVGGDNVDSPPDSAFTINDLCDTLRLLETVPHGRTPETDALGRELGVIADAVEPALIAGGVHTPNHRWEVAAALARLYRRRPSGALAERAALWLAEGIDIDTDGLYSERSANYAAYVSNPSLSVIADVFGRADARAAVVRNLDATLGLIHPDATVETVHSRRQDQSMRFGLAPFLGLYRRYAVELGRGDFAWAAERAGEQGILHPASLLTDLLLGGRLGERLPDAVAPAPRGSWARSGLVVDENDRRRTVIFGGSDYPAAGRIRSGLATNPTFLRMFAGGAVLDSVRLSRDFFGLGPFRAGTVTDLGDRWRLAETVSANYYQPMDDDDRDARGEYALTDDGRFYGSMSFGERGRDTVAMTTVVDVVPTEEGAVLEVTIDGPDLPWTLELAFRGGRFEDPSVQEGGVVALESGSATYRASDDAIVVTPDAGYRANGVAAYRPGEDYAYLGATDALTGDRLYLTGRAPTRIRIELRAERRLG